MAVSRWHVSRTLAIVLLCGWSPLLWALNDSLSHEYELNISTGLLIEAIKQFSEQTDVQFTVDSQATEVDHLQVQGFRARLSARAALARILAGSTLSTDWQGDHTVRIFPGIVLPPEGAGGQRAMEVTGTRLGGGEGPAPIRVYDREQIDRLGVSSLPGVATYLTQQPFSFGGWVQRSAAQHFQLRGLGVDTTLVLINGRRAQPSASSVSLNAFDLNTIPLTAVERIEVMSDSASAIYGSDAIGGVVNIFLKREIDTPDIFLHYGGADGGAYERRAAGTVGTSGSVSNLHSRSITSNAPCWSVRSVISGETRTFGASGARTIVQPRRPAPMFTRLPVRRSRDCPCRKPRYLWGVPVSVFDRKISWQRLERSVSTPPSKPRLSSLTGSNYRLSARPSFPSMIVPLFLARC